MVLRTNSLHLNLIKLIALARRQFKVRRGSGIVTSLLYPNEMRHRSPIITTVRYDQNLQIAVDTRSWIEWCIFINGYYEPHLINLLQNVLRSDDTALDVGANIGAMTLVMSRLVGCGGRVIAIEPNKEALIRLNHNIALNDLQNITVIPYAVSDDAGQADLYGGTDQSNLGLGRLWTKERLDEKDVQRVLTQTIDTIVQNESIVNIRLIKLDIQGWEYKALLGSQKVLERDHPLITFEIDYNANHTNVKLNDFRDLLTEYGYILYQLNSNGSVHECSAANLEGDFIAAPKGITLPISK